MNRRFASERRASDLATAVRDHFVHVHVELSAASRHPHVQRKHVVMLAREDFVTGLSDKFVLLIAEPLAGMISGGCGFLQNRIRSDHLTRNQILADTEMLQ